MKFQKSYLVITCIFLQCYNLAALERTYTPYVINVFFRPLIAIPGKDLCKEEMNCLFATPGAISKTMLEYYIHAPIIQGIYAVYTGMVTASDANGQVIFPQRHATNSITVVITQALRPVIIYANTVDHMQAKEGFDAAFYQFARKYDEKLKKYVWEVDRLANPKNNIIPGEALVILAKPDQITIKEGKTITTNDPNYLLPHIYVSEKITTAENAIQFVRTAKFYAPTNKIFSYANERYASMMTN